MNRRRLVVLVAAAIAAAALVGLSAAATTIPRTAPDDAAGATVAKTGAVGGPTAGVEKAQDVASYWTKERMRDAKPMGKTRSDNSVSSGPSTSSAPAVTTPRSAPAATQAKRRSAQADDGPATASPDTGTNAADHWTQADMDAAKPMEKTVSDGSSAGSTDEPDPPVTGGPAGTP